MRQTLTGSRSRTIALPRGLVLVAAALGSWMLMTAMWTLSAQLFGFIAAAI